MVVELKEFVSERSEAVTRQARKFRSNPVGFMRKALVDSAAGLKSLKSPVRVVAHSGVKLTAVSGNALQSLIELQSEVVTSALSGAAIRLERAAGAEGVVDMVLDQAEMLGATRERLVDEATRAVEIFRHAGRDVRRVANHTYATVARRPREDLAVAKKTVARKAKRAARTTTARARKLAA